MSSRLPLMIKNTIITTTKPNIGKKADDDLQIAIMAGLASVVYGFALYKDKDTKFSKDFQVTYDISKYLTGFTFSGSAYFLLKYLKKVK